MNFSALSIRHPVPAILLFALLTLLGLASFKALGIQNFPDIEVPVISVNATLEGAAPSQLETEVARKIEDSVASLGGVEHIRTTLTDGSVSISVEFDIDKNADAALNEVRNAVDSVRSDLPQDLTVPVVSKKTTTGGVMIAFVASSKQLDEAELSWLVDNELSKRLLSVPGVGKFSRTGGVDREIQVDLDPARMRALKITSDEISRALRQIRKDASGGRGDISGAVQSIRTLAAPESVEDLRRLEIPLSGGRSVPLSEIATITDGFAERSTMALLDDETVIGFELTRSKGWSEVSVATEVRRVVGVFAKEHPQVTIREGYNTFAPALDNFKGSMELLYEGAFLAIIVVWWFLRDIRATLISAAALPLSIIPAFLVMRLAGFSLDTLTLLALALVVGILVDDAIVEVENIVRHLKQGKKPFEAAMEAADEIGMAVIATTLTLVAVFMPTAFMAGIPGKFFRPFGMTAVAAILASLVVARLLTPMMCAHLMRPHDSQIHEGALLHRYLGWVTSCLDHPRITLIAAILFLVGSLALAPMLPSGFVPAADRNQMMLQVELPPGSALEDTYEASRKTIALLKQIPEVTSVHAAVGSSANVGGGPMNVSTMSDTRKATLVVNLVDRRERALKQSGVEEKIRNKLRELPGIRVAMISSGPGIQLTIVLTGNDPTTLSRVIDALEPQIRGIQGIGNVRSNADLERPEIQITPDFARAADLGVSSEAIAQAVRIATAGDFKMMLAKLNLPERQIPIRVRLAEGVRHDLAAIRQLPVASRAGVIPLETVARIEILGGSTRIDRMDRQRRVSIDIELGKRVIGELLTEVNDLPALKNLPVGVQRPPDGDAQRMKELFGSFAGAMAIGVMCIYIVLVLLFHDFLQPITILVALPLSLGGAFVSLLVTHNAFSMPSVIGILMLMGIVTKNSILLVEYAVVARRERGLNRRDALIDACRKRARPIVMTTIAMGAGMLPVALGIGAEPSFRSPMAIVVIGGLLASTFLSLLVIPVIYGYVDDLVSFIRRLRPGRA
ncbi:Multidrug resistance protein MdtB [Candidatus Magnetaquicoccaceae bacterium FCR-1]|uniref:Multidrug resistance protein MdtB n=1 Tax=Candidatus Magnetaquiglobus chichijimensis TaxID=3141448 RepID=A0ABQ0CDP0_9PROT